MSTRWVWSAAALPPCGGCTRRWGSSWSPTTNGSCATSSRTGCTSCSTDGWWKAVDRTSPPRSSRTATTRGGREMTIKDPIDVEVIRKDFPLLSRTVNERPIVYLDSASSSLQPRQVLSAMDHYYETTHANVHRGVYATAERATELYEGARSKVGRFIGAPEPKREIVFTKNATEADRKSTRLNSSHLGISYAVFCL